MTLPESRPGRVCPAGYRYRPSDLGRPADLEAETLYVVGGLYGNVAALDAVLRLADTEQAPVAIVFNGDFNWFNVDRESFAGINEEVLRHHAIRGNVETELADAHADAGCGCAYPDSVSDAEVSRSNEIMSRLRETAAGFPDLTRELKRLPMSMVACVGGVRVGIVHGDSDSLAGWAYSAERLDTDAGLEKLQADFVAANVDVLASSHTCRAVAMAVPARNRKRALFNNGAAGMPSVRGERYGLLTRIATRPARVALYGTSIAGVFVDGIPLRYDHNRWLAAFTRNWPQGSAAYVSYFERMCRGPEHDALVRLRVTGRTSVADGG
jgi:hypothetical protein